MDKYEEKLIDFIMVNNIKAEHLVFETSCHSVEDAAKTINTSPQDIVKNICLIDEQGNFIVAIIKGEDRVSLSKVGKVLGTRTPKIATPEEILKNTGYPCGGVPSFGFNAIFLIDQRVMEREYVYTGGGSQRSLVKISTTELIRANNGKIVDIRK